MLRAKSKSQGSNSEQIANRGIETFEEEEKAVENLIAKLLQDFEQGKMTRRQLIQSLALAATAASAVSAAPTAAADSKLAQAVYLNHVGYQVADYAKSRDWYSQMFGMKVVLDDGKKANLAVGESLVILHNRPSVNTPVVDHICFTLAGWDKDKSVRETVGADLKRRGLEVRETANSFHIKDPDGFMVQMGGKDQ
jgi:catechol 2,3-dioxygenase-like lactoylglutathione lyase family enzyme